MALESFKQKLCIISFRGFKRNMGIGVESIGAENIALLTGRIYCQDIVRMLLDASVYSTITKGGMCPLST
jgi:hypothetical protein